MKEVGRGRWEKKTERWTERERERERERENMYIDRDSGRYRQTSREGEPAGDITKNNEETSIATM